MGVRYRKSKKIGPVRITASKSGLSASIGVKGLRVTKLANGRVRTTASIPGTGISYVKDMSSKKEAKSVNSTKPIFPYVHSDFSFWACIVACFGCLLGAYDSGSAMYLFISVGFLLIAISFKRRNKREREAYDLAVANHIAQQQEKEQSTVQNRPGNSLDYFSAGKTLHTVQETVKSKEMHIQQIQENLQLTTKKESEKRRYAAEENHRLSKLGLERTDLYELSLIPNPDPAFQQKLRDLKVTIALKGFDAFLHLNSEENEIRFYLDDFFIGVPFPDDAKYLSSASNSLETFTNIKIIGGGLDMNNEPRLFIVVLTIKLKEPLIHRKYISNELPRVQKCFGVDGDRVCYVSSTKKIHLSMSFSCNVSLNACEPMLLQEAVDKGCKPCAKCF